MATFAQHHFVFGADEPNQPGLSRAPLPRVVESFKRGLRQGATEPYMTLTDREAPPVLMRYLPLARTAGVLLFTADSGLVGAGIVLSGLNGDDDERVLDAGRSIAAVDIPAAWLQRLRESPRPCVAVFHHRRPGSPPDIIAPAISVAAALFDHWAAGA